MRVGQRKYKCKMLIVDREKFMLWSQGILLENKRGRCIVADNADHDEAEKRMNDGETIGLAHKGVIVTKMKLTEDGYSEFIDEDCHKGPIE